MQLVQLQVSLSPFHALVARRRRAAPVPREGRALTATPRACHGLPDAIGTIAALFLHLLLPEDRVLDEEKEGYKRAFSDGEIAYES